MIAVETNLLVFAHREDAEWHDSAYAALEGLAEGSATWAIPWPCVHEFLAITTHPRIYAPPTPLAVAIDQLEAWMASPTLVLLSETGAYWKVLTRLLRKGRVQGPKVHDARVAALCIHHGVQELWSADRDFTLFPDLDVRNPLMGS